MGVVIKQSAKSTLYSYIGIAIGFVNTIILFPKMLTLEEIGLFKLMLSFCILLNPILQFNVSTVITKYFHYFKESAQKRNSFVSFAILFPVIGFILFIVIALSGKLHAVNSIFSQNAGLFIHYTWYLIPLAFFFVFSNVLESLILMQLKSVFLTFLKNVLLRILNTGIVILYFYDYIDQQELVLSFVVTYGVQFVLLLLYFLHSSKYKIESPVEVVKSSYFKSILSFMLLIFIGGSGATIVAQIDSVMSSYKLGLEYTGVYSIAFFIAIVIEIPRRNIIQIVSPLLSKALNNNNSGEVKTIYHKTAVNQFIASALVFMLIMFNLPEIYSFIPKTANFALIEKGMPVVFIIGISLVFDMLMGCNSEIIHFSKFYYWNAILIPLLAISAILFNLYFIDIMDNGLTAIAYATMCTIFIHNCIRCSLIYYYFKILPFTMGHLKLLGIIALTVMAVSFIPTISFVFLSIGIKSIAIVALFGAGIILMNVSADVSDLFQKIKTRFLKQ